MSTASSSDSGRESLASASHTADSQSYKKSLNLSPLGQKVTPHPPISASHIPPPPNKKRNKKITMVQEDILKRSIYGSSQMASNPISQVVLTAPPNSLRHPHHPPLDPHPPSRYTNQPHRAPRHPFIHRSARSRSYRDLLHPLQYKLQNCCRSAHPCPFRRPPLQPQTQNPQPACRLRSRV